MFTKEAMRLLDSGCQGSLHAVPSVGHRCNRTRCRSGLPLECDFCWRRFARRRWASYSFWGKQLSNKLHRREIGQATQPDGWERICNNQHHSILCHRQEQSFNRLTSQTYQNKTATLGETQFQRVTWESGVLGVRAKWNVQPWHLRPRRRRRQLWCRLRRLPAVGWISSSRRSPSCTHQRLIDGLGRKILKGIRTWRWHVWASGCLLFALKVWALRVADTCEDGKV